MSIAFVFGVGGVGQRRIEDAEAHAVAEPHGRPVGPCQPDLPLVDDKYMISNGILGVNGFVGLQMYLASRLGDIGQGRQFQVAKEQNRTQPAHHVDGCDAFTQLREGIKQPLQRGGVDGGIPAEFDGAGARAVFAPIKQIVGADKLPGADLATQRDAPQAFGGGADAILVEAAGR